MKHFDGDNRVKRNDWRGTLSEGGTIYVTDGFMKNVQSIYGRFQTHDDEYPTMGVTIAGAPVFVECAELPSVAVTRRRFTDTITGDHPAVNALWRRMLDKYQGKCRYASIHIHPMNLPQPSSVDVRNYESVRTNASNPNTYEVGHPFPFILINLHQGQLEVLGFWVMNGECFKGEVIQLADDDPLVESSWKNAPPLSYYSDEYKFVQSIQRCVSDRWTVSLGTKNEPPQNVIKVTSIDGNRFMLNLDRGTVLGVRHTLLESGAVIIEDHIHWEGLFDSLVCALKEKASAKEEQAGSTGEEKNAERIHSSQSAHAENTSVDTPPSSETETTEANSPDHVCEEPQQSKPDDCGGSEPEEESRDETVHSDQNS